MPQPISERMLKLAEAARARAGAIDEPKTVYDYAMRYRRLEGQAFNLKRFLPLQALYEDTWPLIDVMKPAQRGVSEWAISLVCFALDKGARQWVPDGSKEGLNVGYVFPARGDLIEFSKERLSGLKDESAYLATLFAGEDKFDSLSFKQVRDSFLYLRGGYSTTGLRSFPCDVLILDEYDELDPGAVALARRRLNASVVRRLIRISTPTIPGKGISAAFAASDQRVYETPCSTCGTECDYCERTMPGLKGVPCGAVLEDGTLCSGSSVTWNQFDFHRDVWADGEPWDGGWQKWSQAHIASANVELHCPVCHTPQTLEDRTAPGRWIALAPEVTRVHGYHIPWWPFIFIDLQELAQSAVSDDPTEQEQFYRSDLGIPHGAGGSQLSAEMLAQLAAELPNGLPNGPWRDTVMGVDVGSRLHYSIDSIGPGDRVYVRAMGSAPDWKDIDALMASYQVRQCVVDAEPEILTAAAFCERWRGRALRAFYPSTATALRGELMHRKENTSFDVQINRTMILDLVFATVVGATELWPKDIAENDEVVNHFTNLTRVLSVDEETKQASYSWVRTGPDHLAHARGYAIVARKSLPKQQTFAPAVSGVRPIVADYARVAATDLGRLATDRGRAPWWIPPPVR